MLYEPFCWWKAITDIHFQVTYIAFVSVEWYANMHGTPVHQWNMTYETLQLNLFVRTAILLH